MSKTLAFLLCVSAVACAAPGGDDAEATTDPPTGDACRWQRGFRISADSIGPLAVNDPVGVVREQCSQARPITRPKALVEVAMLADTIRGIAIPVPGGEVTAWRRDGHVLDSAKADLWVVRGDGALPDGPSMASSWRDVRSAYGVACQGFAEPEQVDGSPAYVAMRFPRPVGFTFFLENLDLRELAYPNRFEAFFDPSSVPDSATIAGLLVSTRAYGMTSEDWCS